MVRTPCCDKTGLKKGTWTPEEDSKLKRYINEHGCSNWRQLPKLAGLSRCGKSCRLRWMNYLRPNIKRGNFSQEEEDIIVKLHESLGNRWSAIAAELPGRTDNEVKNHWHTYLKKQSRQISISQGEKSSSKGRSKCKNTGGKRSEFKNSSNKNPTHQIVESSQFSPKPSSSDQLCLSVMDTLAVKTQSFIAENGVSASEIFAETAGSFWTEPFLADNYDATYDVLAPLVNNGFLYPNYPLTGEELLGSYGFYDEHNNVLIW